MVFPRTRTAFLVAVLGSALSLLVAATARPAPQIEPKKAEARQVLAQVQALDASLEKEIEAYNAAQITLDRIVTEQKVNARRLEIVRGNYKRAQANLAERLVALYTSSEQSELEVLLGAASFDELLDRIDTVNRVSEEDARIVTEVQVFRAELKKREGKLKRAHTEQERVVAERAARRAEIERRLAERQGLLRSIRNEIARLQAAEARRQERLAAQARDRLGLGAGTGSPAIAATGAIAAGGGDPPPSQYGGVVGIAMRYLGIPYKWAGSSPGTGFDCSGFIMYVYSQVGVSLPHNAAMQFGHGSPVSRESLQPGDLVFFNGLGHNGIYIGANQFIHSPHTGDVVKISSITGWYAATYVGARRL